MEKTISITFSYDEILHFKDLISKNLDHDGILFHIVTQWELKNK